MGGSVTKDKSGKVLREEKPTADHPEGNRAREAEAETPEAGTTASAPPSPAAAQEPPAPRAGRKRE